MFNEIAFNGFALNGIAFNGIGSNRIKLIKLLFEYQDNTIIPG